MDILYLLVPLSVVLALVIGAAFWIAIDGGQFEDLDSPALSVLTDDDRPPQAPGIQAVRREDGGRCLSRPDEGLARPRAK
jgi:cbb3-type cytochrome oxidase maturation protein